jgi:hypothetical protein
MWRRDACQGSPIFSNSAYWFLRIWVILLSAKCSLPRPLDPALAIANRFMKLAGAVWRGPWSHRPADHLYASWQLGNFSEPYARSVSQSVNGLPLGLQVTIDL